MIAAFEARWAWYRRVNKASAHKDYVTASIACANEINAWHDWQFIRQGINWRLALPHTGSYPYTEMLRFDWADTPIK